MKINKLEIENVKRVRALTLEPSANGLTVIGGRNGRGPFQKVQGDYNT